MATKHLMRKAYMCDPTKCFDHAIIEGVLSDDEMAHNFAGDYMYMGSTETFDCFKHIAQRFSVTCQHGLSAAEIAAS